MAGNVLHQELLRALERFRSNVAVHDKGVLLGFALSLFPILPVSIFGLIVGLANRSLHKAGKLNGFDYALVKRGLVLAVINIAIGVLIAVWFYSLVSSFDLLGVAVTLMERASQFIQYVFRLPRGSGAGVMI